MNGRHLVREARRRAGLSQRELAVRVGTTQSAIARLEAGTTSPSLEHLVKVIRAAGFDLDVRLVPHDSQGWTVAQTNLNLSTDERIRRMLASERAAASARGLED